MPATVAKRMKNSQYTQTVGEFLRAKGRVYCLTDDAQFITAMRGLLTKDFGQPDAFACVAQPAQMSRLLHEDPNPPRLIFVERVLGGKDMAGFVSQIKKDFPHLRVIVLTSETVRHRVVLLHEAGADSFIVKPISANGIIEKMAFTLKPQGKLGQLLDLARIDIVNNKPQQALDLCQQVLELKAQSAAAFLIMGDAFRALGRQDDALVAYEQASEAAEMFLEPLRKLAEVYNEIGSIEKRLRCLLRLNRLSPLNIGRKFDIASSYLQLDNLSAATGMFEEALRLAAREGAEEAAQAASRAASLCAEHDPDMCAMYIGKVYSADNYTISPDDIETTLRLGQSLRRIGKPRDAVVQYRQALTLLPDDPRLCYNAGMAYAEARSFSEAQALLNKALTLNPDLPRKEAATAFGIAQVFIHGGGKERAIECLQMALECDPEYAPAQEALAKLQKA